MRHLSPISTLKETRPFYSTIAGVIIEASGPGHLISIPPALPIGASCPAYSPQKRTRTRHLYCRSRWKKCHRVARTQWALGGNSSPAQHLAKPCTSSFHVGRHPRVSSQADGKDKPLGGAHRCCMQRGKKSGTSPRGCGPDDRRWRSRLEQPPATSKASPHLNIRSALSALMDQPRRAAAKSGSCQPASREASVKFATTAPTLAPLSKDPQPDLSSCSYVLSHVATADAPRTSAYDGQSRNFWRSSGLDVYPCRLAVHSLDLSDSNSHRRHSPTRHLILHPSQ